MRDNNWLKEELETLWQRHFPNIERKNKVLIKFGRRARTRLGSIKEISDPSTLLRINKQLTISNNSLSVITINGLFKDEIIPKFVIQATITHELIHYAHGFSSPHGKKQEYPHYGGVIKKEMANRGLLDVYLLQKKWLKLHWKNYIQKNLPQKDRRRYRRRPRIILIKRRWV